MKNLIILTAIFTIAVSCSDVDDFKLSTEELRSRSESIATDNNLMISNAEEIMDITRNILIGANITAHGRVFNTNATADQACDPAINHFYLTDLTHYDTILYVGRLVLDYGDGNTCNSTSVRKGKVLDDFLYILNTKSELYSSRETITFENYQKDSHKIEGSFLITSNSKESITLSTTNARISYPDGTFMTMQGELFFAPESSESTSMHFTGSLEGVARSTEIFTSTITSPIEYRYACSDILISVPVKGTVLLNVNRNVTTVEYGNGICDRAYTISSGGNSNTYEF